MPSFTDDVRQTAPPAQIQGEELLITHVNHSTVLLQRRGMNLLTDPTWSERASPFSWIGPRRRLPGVRREDLPAIDAVLISHYHYDRLDLSTLQRLAAHGGSAFVVAARVGALLRSRNIEPVHELDWSEFVSLAGRAFIVFRCCISQGGESAIEMQLRGADTFKAPQIAVKFSPVTGRFCFQVTGIQTPRG